MPTFQITGPDGKKYRVTGDNPAGAMSALKNMLGEAAPKPRGHDVPEFVPPGVEGYDPKTGEVTPQYGMAESAARGAADMATFGFIDELASFPLSWATGKPRDQVLSHVRRDQAGAREQNPGSYLAGQVAGGLGTGLALGPASLTARAGGAALLPRVAAGAADGAAFGGLYGAGSGTDGSSRAIGALKDGGMGLLLGGAFPVLAGGLGRGYEMARNAFRANPIARRAGTTPEALRALGNVLDADGSLGAQGHANMARAGQEAMLVDAGPTARGVLDTAIQRGGPGAQTAGNAVQQRAGRDAQRLTQALDSNFGAPQGVTAARNSIRTGSRAARSGSYQQAYAQPIDYADPRGQAIEQIVRGRVPQSAIQRANQLMRAEGVQSRQIHANIADDGTVTFERLPDVRQLDYITRALNDLAESGEGAGALGGQTALGRAYQGLARDIRDNLRELVPEYGVALETAADPIRRSQAVKLGSRLGTMARDEFSEAVQGMTRPERQAVLQGFRSRLDDQMARVTRAMTDGDMDAREAIKGLRELSSRQTRENIRAVMDDPQAADALFDEIDRVTQSFELRANVATNSRTFGRQATERRVTGATERGATRTAMAGEPINASKRVIQGLTGETDEALRGRQDEVYSELARLLTQRGGAGQGIYDAINQLGQTDLATQLMSARLTRGLAGPHLAYPAATQATPLLPFQPNRGR